MTTPIRSSYIGRFAPTPSGSLHFGSLVAAVASFLDAKAHQGQWLIRIEDLDTPRCKPGASDHILHTLDAYGLEWDGPVVYQSQRHHLYQAALVKLTKQGILFSCHCSRSQLQTHTIYPGYCRHRSVIMPSGAEASDNTSLQPQTSYAKQHINTSVRIVAPDICVGFDDIFMPPYQESIARATGDFILRRKEGLYAYQLAVVVDDAEQDINHVIRGADLYTQTPRQIFLQQQLHIPQPVYGHIPLIVNQAGQKLSKQNHAIPISVTSPAPYMALALARLNHPLPTELNNAPVASQLAYAIDSWQRHHVPKYQQDPHPFTDI